jgi:dihydrofolate synthase / folylpolyglutamate synthase
MEIESALNKLFSLQKFGIKLGLFNIEKFLEFLGNPQNKFPTFHIAGSNGKGSTASFIASILTEAGYKAGLYTSPHFVKFNERIRIGNSEIPDEYVLKFIRDNFDFIEQNKLTFFEATTALAFKYFADININYGVIETGLGGRLDATNVLNPLASIITSISLEHTDILGDTIEQIAEEKAGIVKKDEKTFIGRLPDEAVKIIQKKCDNLNNKLFRISDYVELNDNAVCLKTDRINIPEIIVPLRGQYQKYNASLALLTLTETLNLVDQKILNAGLRNVISNTGIQGRYEVYNEIPKVIFDSAHNLESVQNFLSCFKDEKDNYKKKILLFGAMRDKAIAEMLNELKLNFDEIHFTEIDLPRCAKVDELTNIAKELSIKSVVEINTELFIDNFIKSSKDDCLVILGSMYILGSIKEKLLSKKRLDIFS